jgi:predicted Zn-ribbon and HTH transcriptional regulator
MLIHRQINKTSRCPGKVKWFETPQQYECKTCGFTWTAAGMTQQQQANKK